MNFDPERIKKSITKICDPELKSLKPTDPGLVHLTSWLSCAVYGLSKTMIKEFRSSFGPHATVKFIGPTEDSDISSDSEAFFIQKNHVIIVACRGSEPSSYEDWINTDANHAKVPALGLGSTDEGNIHGGFANALGPIWGKLLTLISTAADALAEQGSSPLIILCGHSLGGALTNLIAASLAHEHLVGTHNIKLDNLYALTYGQPKTGDAAFAKWYNNLPVSEGVKLQDRTYRHVYHHDIVPRVPSKELAAVLKFIDDDWQHCGHEVYYDREGVLTKGHPKVNLTDTYLWPWLEVPMPSAIHDHFPWLYVLCTETDGKGHPDLTGPLHLVREIGSLRRFTQNAVTRLIRRSRDMILD